MLYFDRIDVSRQTDVNKTSPSKKSDTINISYIIILSFNQMSATVVIIF